MGREERLTERVRARFSLPTPGKPFRRRRKGGGEVALMSELVSWLDTMGEGFVEVYGDISHSLGDYDTAIWSFSMLV